MVYSANPISKEQLQRAINAQLESAGLPTSEDGLIEMIEEYGGGDAPEYFMAVQYRSYTDSYYLSPIFRPNETFNFPQADLDTLFNKTFNFTYDAGESDFTVAYELIKIDNGALATEISEYVVYGDRFTNQGDLYDALKDKGEIGPAAGNNAVIPDVLGWRLVLVGAKFRFTGQAVPAWISYNILS